MYDPYNAPPRYASDQDCGRPPSPPSPPSKAPHCLALLLRGWSLLVPPDASRTRAVLAAGLLLIPYALLFFAAMPALAIALLVQDRDALEQRTGLCALWEGISMMCVVCVRACC